MDLKLNFKQKNCPDNFKKLPQNFGIDRLKEHGDKIGIKFKTPQKLTKIPFSLYFYGVDLILSKIEDSQKDRITGNLQKFLRIFQIDV